MCSGLIGPAVQWPSRFAPVLLRFGDFDEFEDATLMKQKIAACLAVLTTDPNGQALGVGGVGDTATAPETDSLEPGMITNLPPGRDIHVIAAPVGDGLSGARRSRSVRSRPGWACRAKI